MEKELIIDNINFKPKSTEYLEKYLQKNFEFVIPKTKNKLVLEILKRWWYNYDWPIEKDYNSELKEFIKNSEEKLKYDDFKLVDGYNGVYENLKKGNFIDLRNKDNKPCFNRLKNLDINELSKILNNCLLNQIKELKETKNFDYDYYKQLKRFYKKFNRAFEKILNN